MRWGLVLPLTVTFVACVALAALHVYPLAAVAVALHTALVVHTIRRLKGLAEEMVRTEAAAREQAAALEARSEELLARTDELIEQQRDAAQQRLTLEDQNKELSRLSSAKSAFLASISHELRTPLNAVLGFAELLMEGVAGKLNEAQAEYLGDIKSSGTHLLRLINDILDYSKLEAGKLTLAHELVPLEGPVREAVDMLRGNAQRKGVELSATLEEGALVEGDPLRLKQVALNLVANAVKFTPRGGTVAVALATVGRRVLLSVRDTGIGIDKAHHHAIFEAFQQVEGDASRRFEGTGLGLALVKKLLLPMGGTVRVESEVGHGATFVVELERKSASRVVVAPPEGGRRVEVVVAEDDDATRHMVSRVLQANQYLVRGAANGQRALEALAERLPDVLLLDLMMPELDGYQVLERLRALPGGEAVKVLVFSATEPTDERRAMLERLGAQILVKGTVATQELVVAVAQLGRAGGAGRTAA